MRVRILFRCLVLLAVSGTMGIAEEAEQSPTAAEQCKSHQAERGELERSGVRAWLAKDPSDPAAGLSQEQIGKIRRLIELDEAVLFKCRLIEPKPKGEPGAKNTNLQAALPAGKSSSEPPEPPTRRPKRTGKPGPAGLNKQEVPLPVRPNNARE